MTRKKRLSSDERKKEIMSSAARFFIEKGFSETTMEDVVSGTTMSKGGVYYYYSNTVDILHDLMIEGNRYRVEAVRETMTDENRDDLSFVANAIVDKMLTHNQLVRIYVIFLLEMKRNEKLKTLYETLRKESTEEILKLGKKDSEQVVQAAVEDFIMHMVNSVIVGAEVLDARDCFLKNRRFLVAMVKIYLEEKLNDAQRGGSIYG